MNGCPTNAYEKDPVTGIVRHLDDQCFGCQYCILKCPYDVPKYSKKRGIVRKCDMCHSRLAVGEAPACVQACPNGAIRIETVSKETVRRAANQRFLPGAPLPDYTLPTTRYTSKRGLPNNMRSADFHNLKPQHAHPPLVVMLVLTQLSVGGFGVAIALRRFFPAELMQKLTPFHSLVALALGLLAIGASVLHLGRPLYAWRAVVGLKTSWLSREIVAFGLFAGLAVAYASSFWISRLSPFQQPLGVSVFASGLGGIFCSLKIYQDTRRKFWNGALTAMKFFGSAALLGPATILFTTTARAVFMPDITADAGFRQITARLGGFLIALTVLKLLTEASTLRHLLDKEFSPLKRTALLMVGELGEAMGIRFITGLLGGVVLPLYFLISHPAPGLATLAVTCWILFFALLGELLERYLFFTAVIAPKMPGGMNA